MQIRRFLDGTLSPPTGFVVRLPSKVLWIVTRYTFESSTNQMICGEKSSPKFCDERYLRPAAQMQ